MEHTRVMMMVALVGTFACAPVETDGEPDGADAAGAVDGTTSPDSGVVTAAQPTPAPDSAGYRAGGNEPFWTMTFGDTTMDFADMGNTTTASASRPDAESVPDGWRYAATSNGQPFVVEIRDRRCNDSMSGRPFPHSVTVAVDGRTYTGCGGDTASLLTGDEWRVTHLGGAAAASQRQPTMSFGTDGTLTGDGGCNQYRATFEITGEGIEIGPAVATRRACAEAPLNEQETRFFALLEQAVRFDIADDGSLEMHGPDGVVIRASRGP